jgi:hypothetical protein
MDRNAYSTGYDDGFEDGRKGSAVGMMFVAALCSLFWGLVGFAIGKF